MKLTFSQFNQFVDLGEEANDEQLTEIFGFFKSNPTKLDAAKQKRKELEKQYGKDVAAKKYALRQKQQNLAWAKAKKQAETGGKPFDKKPSSELTAAQNRAAERDWVRGMQTEDQKNDDDKPFEVHGVMGLNSKPFRKTFKNRSEFEKWMEKNDGDVDVQGYRDLDESQIMEASKPKVHTFENTREAYDRCQYDESIKIGDTLVIPSEQVVGIADAWPVAVTEKHGGLHTVVDGHSMVKHFAHEGLSGVVEAAVAVAKKHGWPVRKEALMK